jgi:FkbM family methyltransferase
MSVPPYIDRLLRHARFSQSEIVRELRRRPLGFVDIGARGNVDPALAQLAGVTAVLGFEPDPEEARRLLAVGRGPWADFSIETAALGDREGPATLYLAAEPNNHSLRPTNAAFVQRYAMEKFFPTGSIPLDTTTLDRVIFEKRAGEVSLGEFLKVDTQGTELEILKGARRTLAERTKVVVCEIEFAPIYSGQALFSDVELFMRDCGFAFFGFSELHARSRKRLDKTTHGGRERLLWSDAVFFKDPIVLSSRPVPGERGSACLIASALMLGFYDYALELAEWAAPAAKDGATFVADIMSTIEDLARMNTARTIDDAVALSQALQKSPHLANVIVGQFVDRRRRLHDYDDVRLESPWLGRTQTLSWEPQQG